jgi:curved DNA-binding protein CbpA
MSNKETFYSVVGVDKYADQAKIRKAYLKLSLKYHPDKNPGKEVEAKEQFVKIGEAYQVLSDQIRRSGYDQDIASGRYSHEHSASYDPTDSSTEDEDQRPRPPSKSYETHREAFDAHVAHMTDDELRAATGAAAVFGEILGSLVGSGLARKVPGKNKLAGALFETAGSLLGSTVGSEAGVGLVQNVHVQSRDRICVRREKAGSNREGRANS